MNVLKLKETIDTLSKVVSVTDTKKQELIKKYADKTDQEVIKGLALTIHQLLKDNEALYTYSLEIIRNINRDICPPVDEMKERLNKMFVNEVNGNMSLEDNHQLINETLTKITKLFNQYGIDYYVVGALACFIKTNQPLFRYHDDIDIMLNEDDISKVGEIMSQCGYDFHDDRFPNMSRYREMQETNQPHIVIANNPGNEFHLGFFTFKRNDDKSITMRDYSHRINNDHVAVDILERQSDLEGTALWYDDNPTNFMDTSFKTGTVESVYLLKEFTKRPKDITDMQKLEPFINKEKLAKLIEHATKNTKYSDVLDLSSSKMQM